MNLPNFNISTKDLLSSLVRKKGILNFHDLCQYTQNLPYVRISDKSDLTLTMIENCGTCSSKHAFLKQIIIENKQVDIQLIVSIFKMNATNTPAITSILKKAKLEYIPEAHCYLKYKNERFDFTKKEIDVNDFKEDILIEKEIQPEQVGTWKVNFQKEFILNWLLENEMKYSLNQIWDIREQCILAIAADS